ncbi:MAG: 7-cyano-7-deazaguanine synthase QueC [Desulfuromonadaceae bacterium]|nr:7-cyano-7-deazaguanine synthase QueC [Desulfuromonas sp.]MDY0184902.1 7-cyano-7-deazaguanine synthase QueC [Desulfuromonadaceae bacterium]
MKKAIVLYSGGLDSTTCVAIARAAGYEVYGLSFSYGQRHSIELECAKKFAPQLGIAKHLILDVDMRQIGGSALTADIAVPENRPIDDEIPITYVPARNTVFLAYALAWAEAMQSFDIYIGVNAVDYSGYPDCRPEFIQAFTQMANLATKAAVEKQGRYTVHTPLMHMSKAQIIHTGTQLGIDYALTHSCYAPDSQGRACGVCDSCVLRLKGFREAGMQDPVTYTTVSGE